MSSPVRLVPLEIETAERLETLVDAMRTEVGYLLSKRGLDQQQWLVLKHLARAEARSEPVHVEALFRRTGMPLDLVLEVVAQLRVRGLVCESNGGVWALTAEGHVLADPIESLEERVAARMFHGVSASELSRAERLLERLTFNIRQSQQTLP